VLACNRALCLRVGTRVNAAALSSAVVPPRPCSNYEDRTIKNIFVVGLDDFHLAQLQTLPGAEEFTLHPLLTYTKVKQQDDFPVARLLGRRCADSVIRRGAHATATARFARHSARNLREWYGLSTCG